MESHPVFTLKSNKGFTLVEMMVVICLIGIIVAFGWVMSLDAYRGFSFRNDRDAVVAALQRARSQAINNICIGAGCTDGKPHGVYFDDTNKQVVIFQGNSYDAFDPFNEKIQFESKTTIITSTSPSVIFQQLSGDSASTTISMADVTYRSADIQINTVGRIDY